ncbi:MAG: hypothetical protein KGI89_03050 [Euryarchaeota archaeon]|nr:hypothetical protein [Euryarchaeota archaeon]
MEPAQGYLFPKAMGDRRGLSWSLGGLAKAFVRIRSPREAIAFLREHEASIAEKHPYWSAHDEGRLDEDELANLMVAWAHLHGANASVAHGRGPDGTSRIGVRFYGTPDGANFSTIPSKYYDLTPHAPERVQVDWSWSDTEKR